MILELSVENLAILERARLTLGPGLTVLTGEAGAGKSLLVDAIELALGERADAELVRSGAERASVSLTLDLRLEPALRALCEEEGLQLEDGRLFVQREVSAEGRSQCRIAGKLSPVSGLKRLGALLVDLHGQHQHQSLLNAERHVEFLDAWIGEPAERFLTEVRALHGELESARARLSLLRAGLRDREHRLDLLKFQVKEIEEAVLKPGEFAEMETRLSRLQNAERLAQTLGTSLDTLANREGSASEAIGGSIRSLEEAVKWDPALEQALATLREARYSLEEGTRLLRASLDSLDADPETLAHVADRLDALRRLRRKYGEDEDAILAFLQTAKAELDLLEDAEADEESLAADTERLETELGERAQELSSLRHAQEPRFAAVAGREIRELAMDHAVFEVRIEGKAVDAGGLDRVEFFFSANPGEPPRPLAKIASGGEVSRLMLALKGVLAGRAGVPTLIFDEVDSGLGGQTATVVARKLERLAERYQVIVISHLPQIAARAGTHWRIEKRAVGGRTETVLSLLSQPERLEEVARMLAGDLAGAAVIAAARELMHPTVAAETTSAEDLFAIADP